MLLFLVFTAVLGKQEFLQIDYDELIPIFSTLETHEEMQGLIYENIENSA